LGGAFTEEKEDTESIKKGDRGSRHEKDPEEKRDGPVSFAKKFHEEAEG
jgi:hypothetical protein